MYQTVESTKAQTQNKIRNFREKMIIPQRFQNTWWARDLSTVLSLDRSKKGHHATGWRFQRQQHTALHNPSGIHKYFLVCFISYIVMCKQSADQFSSRVFPPKFPELAWLSFGSSLFSLSIPSTVLEISGEPSILKSKNDKNVCYKQR